MRQHPLTLTRQYLISMNIYSGTPYTYYISWTALDLHYYGVRFANHCHPNDFWKKYFTSSDKVKSIRKQYGDPDVIKIRRTFNSVDQARCWESRVLKKLKVLKDNRWLNANVGKAYSWKSGVEHQNYGRVFSQEARQKQSISKSKLRWWNNGIEQSFSELPPGTEYQKGRLLFNNRGAKIGANINRQKYWITDGTNEMMIFKTDSIPAGYSPGRIESALKGKTNHARGTHWWNNGTTTKMSPVSPGPLWIRGRL